jgi:hypothetical protein
VRSVEDPREAVDAADSSWQAGRVDKDLLGLGDPDLKVMQFGLIYTAGGK